MFVLRAMTTNDRSIRTTEAIVQEAASFFLHNFRTRVAPAQGPSADSFKLEKGESTGQIGGFDPCVSQKQLAGHGGLTCE